MSSCDIVYGPKPTEIKSLQDLTDPVERPAHYTRLSPEPLDVILAWGLDMPCGSAIKYIARAGFKSGSSEIQDLRKAVVFLQAKIRYLESK